MGHSIAYYSRKTCKRKIRPNVFMHTLIFFSDLIYLFSLIQFKLQLCFFKLQRMWKLEFFSSVRGQGTHKALFFLPVGKNKSYISSHSLCVWSVCNRDAFHGTHGGNGAPPQEPAAPVLHLVDWLSCHQSVSPSKQ